MPYERPAHLSEDDVIADTVVVDLINNIIEREGANFSNVVLIQQHLHLLRQNISMQQLHF